MDFCCFFGFEEVGKVVLFVRGGRGKIIILKVPSVLAFRLLALVSNRVMKLSF